MEAEPTSKATSPLLIPAAIVAAGVVIAASVIYVGEFSRSGRTAAGGTAITPANGAAEAGSAVLGNLADDDPALGDPSAPVTVVEFGDFQCPFCRRLFFEAEPKIIEAYVKTGKVRFVYRDYPISSLHQHAQKAAEAAECADEQGKFWPYHDRLYQRQDELGVANYKRWAVELGLNAEQFSGCLDSGKFEGEVLADLRDGQAAGVTGTPGTFVNGRLVSGALPFEHFKTLIDEALARK